ncbi:MAG: hypothetical protein JJV90_01595 [Spiroplasma sp.]|nr:hypothetical protein [Mycoplasmatales bacterium]
MGILKLQEVDGFIFDVYLGASLLNGENFKKPIDVLSISFGINSVKNYEEVYGAKSNPTMPTIDMVSRDIVSKAEAISKMYIKIVNELEVSKLNDVLYNIELPLTKVLAKMEIMGVNIDEKELDNLNEIYQNKIDKILIEIALITDININSPLQLSEYLFQENELPVKGIKKTKKNYSTDATNLKKLKKMLIIDDSMKKFVQLIDLILKYRIYTKLNSTYLLGIKKYIKKGKINPIYQQLLAETGRLSAIDPNIQNIPIRTEEGQIIRALFNCDEGYEIVAIDYSQVELRIIATMANEEKMLNDFANGLDIHTETAKKILGKDSITKAERSKAKAINFGIIYGMSQYGLAKQINVSNEEAYLFIEKHFETYPKIKIYMESLKTFAHKNEYVTTLFNRRRYLKNINCAGKMDREAAERMAINTPIQGTAADVIKLAMISVDEKITKENLPIKMAMQIHDELVFYMPKDSAKTLTQEIEKVMEMVVENKIQLKVESGFGKNWLEAK